MSRLIFNAVLGGTTTLESTNSVDTFLITVPAANGTMSVKDSSGDATFRNITLTGAVLAGAWNGSTITVPYGGTGAVTLTGYVKGNGTSAMTASATIPNTDITGLGTMSTQNASAVAITGGTISGLGTPLAVASGGSGAATLTGYVKGNGTSAMTASATIPNTDITGLGTMSTQGSDSVTITGGTANGLTIGASNPAAGIFTTLRFNSTLSANGATGTAGQVLTSNGASAPTWQSIAGSGTVTSIDVSGGTTGLTTSGGPVTGSGTITLAGTLGVANGGTGATTLTGLVYGNGTSAMTAASASEVVAVIGTTAVAKATSIAGGATGSLPYQSAADTTAFLAAGSNGQVLTLAAGLPSWATPTTGTVTSVGGTGTVNGLTLTGTVTSSGNLTLGGTLDLSAPPAIGGTTAAAVTGTTITATTKFVGPYFDAANSAGGALRNSSGVAQLQWGGGGGSNVSVDVAININPANAAVSIAPTGTGTVTLNPATASTINNMSIGATTPSTGAFTTLTSSANFTPTSYTETITASGTVGASATLAITAGTILTATLTSATACTFTMPTATAGKSFTLLLKQPASGTATTATFTGVKWGSIGAPTITATVGKLDILAFIADGTNWYGTASQGYTY
jgi:hypothetical protein